MADNDISASIAAHLSIDLLVPSNLLPISNPSEKVLRKRALSSDKDAQLRKKKCKSKINKKHKWNVKNNVVWRWE